jgi:hypothetical protein
MRKAKTYKTPASTRDSCEIGGSEMPNVGALRAKGSTDEPKTGGTVHKSQDTTWR